jgi:methionyl-tRNA synthetase
VEKEPWAIAKDEARRGELGSILYASAEVLRILAVLIFPIMPRAATALWGQLGIPEALESQRLPESAGWGGLAAGTRVTKGDALFPRLED